ncbi:MAG: S1C family serine protease [Polymorphobacter sp.]|uniref:S1C family serine protease n=1 Tax=Polymorphobacter sp. TaxID=1909290 RepID=UPI003A86DF00
MKHLISAALSLAISCPVHAAGLAADVLLEAAVGYTVKIKRTSGIGLNEDSGSSAHATGFLVDKQRGWILTNAHVATRSPTTLSISFKGQSYVKAKRVFVDRLTDVAVLEIAPTAIPATTREAALQCSEQPRIGTAVAVFGHPGELSYTATRGIISSIPWVFPTEVIQSDAVVNGGNSGGPMISLETGKVVGIAAASYRNTDDKHSTATSLSEPIPPVCKILDLLRAGKDARFRQLPVAYATAEDDDLPIVAKVFDKVSGFDLGDRIVSVAGQAGIRNASDIATALRGQTQPVPVVVERNGKEVVLTVISEVFPDVLATRSIDFSGLIISEPWRLDRAEFNHERYPVIDFIRPGSPAEITKAYPGYQLVAVNEQGFTDLDKLHAYLSSLPENADARVILKAPTDAGQFYRQYHHIVLPRGSAGWVKPQ